jgi:hypothetical protein
MLDIQRTAYLEAIDPKSLMARAQDVLTNIAFAKAHLNEAREQLREAADLVEDQRTRLMLSAPYGDKTGPGKNAETREAWLGQQRTDDREYAFAIEAQRATERELARETVRLDILEREYQLARDAIRLAAAQLNFLAE